VLQITERGERIVCQLLPKLFQPLRGIFEDISEIQQRNLIAQLRRIAERLEATHRSECIRGCESGKSAGGPNWVLTCNAEATGQIERNG
jgi:hypothetical protein